MTGAPKRRTTELIDALERRDRGAYAGALGFFSPNGAADLNVVIRTAVLSSLASHAPRVEIAAGGALTALSDVADEWAEVTLKADAVRAALAAGAGVARPSNVTFAR
jgi:anthranilate/para-aminobenzoate synthase component I